MVSRRRRTRNLVLKPNGPAIIHQEGARSCTINAPLDTIEAPLRNAQHSKGKICPDCEGWGTLLQEDGPPEKCGWCGGSGKLRPC